MTVGDIMMAAEVGLFALAPQLTGGVTLRGLIPDQLVISNGPMRYKLRVMLEGIEKEIKRGDEERRRIITELAPDTREILPTDHAKRTLFTTQLAGFWSAEAETKITPILERDAEGNLSCAGEPIELSMSRSQEAALERIGMLVDRTEEPEERPERRKGKK